MTSNSSQRFGPPRKRVPGQEYEIDFGSVQPDLAEHSNKILNYQATAKTDWLPVVELIPQYECSTHGPLNSNLCARCMADLADVKFEDEEQESFLEFICRVIDNFYFNRVVPFWKKSQPALAYIEPILRGLWAFLQFVFSVVSACFVCFFLMWFVQPSRSPQEEARDEKERLRKKKQDEEWRAERDARWAKERADQEAWEDQRDADYRKSVDEQIAWEKERDKEFRKRQKEADEAYHKQREDDERRKDEAIKEARELAEKIAKSDLDPENDLRKMEDIGKELKSLHVPDATPDKPIEKIKKDALDSRMDKASDELNAAVSIYQDMWERDTNDGSRDQKFDKAVDKLDQHLEDAEKIRKRTKKEY